MNIVSSEYVDDLMQEVVELCTKSTTERQGPLQEAPTLASRMERPYQAQAVKELTDGVAARCPVTQSLLHFVKSSIFLRWILFSHPECIIGRQWDKNIPSHIIPAESHQLTDMQYIDGA